MDVSRGLTVGAHHEAPYGSRSRWIMIPTEDGEDRAIVRGVVLRLTVQAFGGGLVLAGDLHRSHVRWPPMAIDAAAAER